jgi:membrane protein YdbS with pleckstrin-like domain
MVSPFIIRFIGEMQVYRISHIKLSLTRYAAIAFFVVILIDIIYIIWNLIGWYSVEYALTDSKIIIKSGVLSTKRNYMPYATIQDINTSQGILAKIFNVGTVSVFSAYDNNQMELKDISNPSEVEEIIFTRMVAPRGFQQPPQMFAQQHQQPNYRETEEFYDEYEPITPITHERNSFSRGEYEYYPEDLGYNDGPRHTYEYEPYDSKYSNSPNNQSQGNHYNRVRDEYSPGNDDYYQNYSNSSYGRGERGNYIDCIYHVFEKPIEIRKFNRYNQYPNKKGDERYIKNIDDLKLIELIIDEALFYYPDDLVLQMIKLNLL